MRTKTMRTKIVAAISAATVLTVFSAGASFAATAKVPSNADDHFVTKPTTGNKIDLAATIEVDAKGYPTKQSQQLLFDEMDFQ